VVGKTVSVDLPIVTMVEVSSPVPGNMVVNFCIALSFLYNEDYRLLPLLDMIYF
jgi:hypothetical protein